MIAAPPAIAGIQPQPFLNFDFVTPPDDTSPLGFIVTLPTNPIQYQPVERLVFPYK